MKIELNKTQSRPLSDLRGTPADVHMMLMTEHITTSGGTLEGSEETFEALVEFISEELEEGMLSVKSARDLKQLCIKIDPESADWLGA